MLLVNSLIGFGAGGVDAAAYSPAGALLFDGVADYLAWIRSSTPTGNQRIFTIYSFIKRW